MIVYGLSDEKDWTLDGPDVVRVNLILWKLLKKSASPQRMGSSCISPTCNEWMFGVRKAKSEWNAMRSR